MRLQRFRRDPSHCRQCYRNCRSLSRSGSAAQVRGRVKSPARALDRIVDFLLFVLEVHRDVAARLQVVMHLEHRRDHRQVVPVLVVQLGHAPQLAAAIVARVDRDDVPAVLGIDASRRAAARRCLGSPCRGFSVEITDHPDAVQLIAREVLVDVAGLEDIGVLVGRIRELVRVVRDVHLALAQQLPLVAVRGAVVHAEVIVGAQAVGRGARIVVAHVGRQAHAALAGVVGPRAARLARPGSTGLVARAGCCRRGARSAMLLCR